MRHDDCFQDRALHLYARVQVGDRRIQKDFVHEALRAGELCLRTPSLPRGGLRHGGGGLT